MINRGIVQGSGIGPILYIINENDLKPLSSANTFPKYADDANLLVPDNADISLPLELENVKAWALLNKMITDFSKTTQIVFHRPGPHQNLHPSVIDYIKQVNEVKLLGVVINR
jgi:hypothetical protein